MAQILATASSYDIKRSVRLPVAEFPPTMWADTFTSFSLDTQVQEKLGKEIEALQERVRKMLTFQESSARSEKLILIDNLERLGVAYHFKPEIEEYLQDMFNNSDVSTANDDLSTTALQFRLLRQHRHHVSSSVFNKFKDENGKFEEGLSSDGKGLLSLYEAAYVRIFGEHILEEGLTFATHHLKLLAPKLKCPLNDQVARALDYPLHWGHPRMEARHYISFYERDNLHNEVLLKLAKLDFDYVQILYKKELHDLCKWWNKFDLKSKLTYARDRVVETHFWTTGMIPEPHDSFNRVASTKCTLIIAVIDDTYDNYATIEEADNFTQIMQRWDLNEIGQLPDYMKVVYKFIMSTYEELEREASDCGRSFAAPYIREIIKELARGYNQELKWFMGMEIPPIEAYYDNQIIACGIYPIYGGAMLLKESVSDEVFQWIVSRPKLLVASGMIGRYRNDIASHGREVKEGQMLTGISMYMKHHGVTEEEATNRMVELSEEAWMDINTEHLNLPSTHVPHDVSDALLNYARAIEIMYKYRIDGFSFPEKLVATEIADTFIHSFNI